jgi:hypothetical protein
LNLVSTVEGLHGSAARKQFDGLARAVLSAFWAAIMKHAFLFSFDWKDVKKEEHEIVAFSKSATAHLWAVCGR